MVILDLSCIGAESFYFSHNFFYCYAQKSFTAVCIPTCPTSTLQSPKVLNLSPHLLGLSGRSISSSWKREAGWQCLARKRKGLRSGWDLCYWRWCIYLRTRVNSNSCQNGELKHRLQDTLWYLKLRRRLLEDKVAWVNCGESYKQCST